MLLGMRRVAVVVAALIYVSAASGSTQRVIASGGVRVTVPTQWHRLAPVRGVYVSPKTLLVVGSPGVVPTATGCQIAAYKIPSGGAAVVVVGWDAVQTSNPVDTGLAPLRKLTMAKPHTFECYPGKGDAASLVLKGRAYQVNVMVGAHATPQAVAAALAVARSFRLR